MTSPTLNSMLASWAIPQDPYTQIFIVGASLVLLIGYIFAFTFRSSRPFSPNRVVEEFYSALGSFLRFFYASFLKPHSGDGTGNGQQDALQSLYKAQAGVHEVARKSLLRGREDMLGLGAAQLVQKAARERTHDPKRIWVDVRTHFPHVYQPTDTRTADWWRNRLEHRGHV